MIQFIEERGNPFNVSSTEMKNLSSGEQVDPKLVDFRMKCTPEEKNNVTNLKKKD